MIKQSPWLVVNWCQLLWSSLIGHRTADQLVHTLKICLNFFFVAEVRLAWDMSETCLGHVEDLFETCLGHVLGMFFENFSDLYINVEYWAKLLVAIQPLKLYAVHRHNSMFSTLDIHSLHNGLSLVTLAQFGLSLLNQSF